MSDETAAGSSGAPDGSRHPRGSSGEQSPLQARAAFIKNRSWESVIGFNRGACERGRAQHGFNSETADACASDWEEHRTKEIAFIELLDFLKSFHRRAPFLFFNGNTFADIARQISAAIFADLPNSRRRELISSVAHYVAGVLDRDSMTATVDSLWQSASFQPGDRIKTLKGTLRGHIVKILDDGRVKWRAETGTEFIALPESLVPED